jgi:hypothetical protein
MILCVRDKNHDPVLILGARIDVMHAVSVTGALEREPHRASLICVRLVRVLVLCRVTCLPSCIV